MTQQSLSSIVLLWMELYFNTAALSISSLLRIFLWYIRITLYCISPSAIAHIFSNSTRDMLAAPGAIHYEMRRHAVCQHRQTRATTRTRNAQTAFTDCINWQYRTVNPSCWNDAGPGCFYLHGAVYRWLREGNKACIWSHSFTRRRHSEHQHTDGATATLAKAKHTCWASALVRCTRLFVRMKGSVLRYFCILNLELIHWHNQESLLGCFEDGSLKA